MSEATSMSRAAASVMHDCLGMQESEELLIVFDESTQPIVSTFFATAEHNRMQVLGVFCPHAQQERFAREPELPLGLAKALAGSTYVLSALSADHRFMPFRSELIDCAWRGNTKVAAMPGASNQSLLAAAVDYEELASRCREVASILARGHEIQIETSDGDRTYTLVARLGRWERLPVPSDGVIPFGAWGNVPSGETYISPIEGTGEGDIIIDGSLPGFPIHEKQNPLRLTFQEGKLMSWEPRNSPAGQYLEKEIIAPAREKGDIYWSNLAEIGIGLNPALCDITGDALLDEKVYGSAHVAIGSSDGWGGQVKATIHCDMVTMAPAISVDGHQIVANRELTIPCAARLIDDVIMDRILSEGDYRVVRSGARHWITLDKELQREWNDASGRVVRAPVGNGSLSVLCSEVFESIPTRPEGIRLAKLGGAVSNANRDQLLEALLHLASFGLIVLT